MILRLHDLQENDVIVIEKRGEVNIWMVQSTMVAPASPGVKVIRIMANGKPIPNSVYFLYGAGNIRAIRRGSKKWTREDNEWT